MKKIIVILPALIAGAAGVNAAEFFQAALTPEIGIHANTTEIRGLALNIWGQNPQHSLTLGLINDSTGDSGGLTWGILNCADSYTGVAWGAANISRENFVGWQGGVLNVSQGAFLGLQSGAINVAQGFQGLQLGLVNYAENLDGVQLGVVNVALNNAWFDEFPDKLATGFPLLNWSF